MSQDVEAQLEMLTQQIINIDVTVIKDGWHGDTSRMFHVGEVSPFAKRLCAVTYECMWRGILSVRPGA